MPDETTPVRLARIEEKIDSWAATHSDHVRQDGEAFQRIEKALGIGREWIRAIVAPLFVGIIVIIANRYLPPPSTAQAAPAQQKP